MQPALWLVACLISVLSFNRAAQKSEELQVWLKKNNAQIQDVKIDRKKQILSIAIHSPNPPLNIIDLYNEIDKARKKAGRSDPFSIDIVWTQGMHLSWPLQAAEQDELRKLKRDYLPFLLKHKWQWTGTQYADGDWLKPQVNQQHILTFNQNNKILINMLCASTKGAFELNQEFLSFEVELHKKCEQATISSRFIADLNLVSGLKTQDEFIALQLQNNAGIMYFEMQ